eukprot:CAMPEP_0167831870 /NCGR_PEP_ID=MMETSP0112_2-20121227/13950_1 /TAXON_ID=91324 /ORGANISM="Lotharella globosa, Strain CCCM811" /LENGTH=60 /DNA_ID=CAMNT_0007736713 /DNA_START=302 /DNA_END=480 /DNA_ORIENTATION=+
MESMCLMKQLWSQYQDRQRDGRGRLAETRPSNYGVNILYDNIHLRLSPFFRVYVIGLQDR